MILAIDTSIVTPGWALAIDGKLIDLTCRAIPKSRKDGKRSVELSIQERYRIQVEMIDEFINPNLNKTNTTIENGIVLVEIPGHRAVDKNQYTIQMLQKTAGWISGYFSGYGFDVYEITPQQWKGNRPKETTKFEIDRMYPMVHKKLADNGVVGDKQHNAYDAAGMLHWFLSNPEYFQVTRNKEPR